MSTTLPASSRDFYFDNLKVVLITLVILAHFAEMYARVRQMHSLFNVLSSFLMPLFIFASGYFSKSIVSQRKTDLQNVLIPYFLLEIYNWIFTYVTGLGAGKLNVAIPTFQNWYLLGLFIWRLVIPYFRFVSMPVAIGISLLISICIGFIPQFNKFLALHRIMYFMFFFVLGYFAPNIKEFLKLDKKYQFLDFLIFAAFISIIFSLSYFNPHLRQIITYAFNPVFGYHEMPHYAAESLYPLLTRFVGLVASIAISISFLFLIPMRRTSYSKFGANTLYVFLFHMFLVWPLAKISYKPIITEVSTIILSVGISYLLSTNYGVRILRVMVHPWYLFKARKRSATKIALH